MKPPAHETPATDAVMDTQPGEGVEARAPASIYNSAGMLLAFQKQAPPVTRVEATGDRPLSFAQERLWQLEQSEPGTPYYHVALAWEIRGALSVAALEQSLDYLVQRHEGLRSTFPYTSLGPVQRVSHWRAKLPVVELGDRPEGERWERVLQLARDRAREAFALDTGPLVRMALYRLRPEAHLLVFIVHQIVFDGASIRIVNRELAEAYRAFSSGGTPTLPGLPVRYSDYAHWQRHLLQGEVLAGASKFWRAQMERRYEPLQLPRDGQPAPSGVTPGARTEVSLPKGLVDELKRMSAADNATPFAAVLASLCAWLGRLTGQTDILILVSSASRMQPELRHVVGLIANVLPLRLDLAGEPTFRQLLRRASQTVSGALAHQALPLASILEMLPGGGQHLSPLQVLMMYNNAPLPTLQVGGVTFTPNRELDTGAAKLDLAFELADAATGMVGHLKYRADRFERSTSERFVRHWRSLLEWAVAHPDLPVSQLPLPADGPAVGCAMAVAPARGAMNGARVPGMALDASQPRSAYAPPRDDLERQLARIWEQVLHVHPIGIHDNFFALGGHSLAAAKILLTLQQEIGRHTRLSLLFEEPTIARLAAALQQPAGVGVAASNLVEIQPQGMRPPLFLVHGVGGGMFWGYSNLARHLGPDQPVLAFKSRGADGGEEFTRIEDMAAAYVAELVKFRPDGPYYLGGYCFGGNVAYEMARQLTGQGRRVDLVCLINSWPGNSAYTHPAWTVGWTIKLLWNFGLRLQHQLRCGAKNPRTFVKWRTAWIRDQFLSRRGWRSRPGVERVESLSFLPSSEAQRRLWRTHVRAWREYSPRPYAGHVLLLRTQGHPLVCTFDGEMGWGELAAGGVTVQICPGDHETILEQENVGETARALRAALDALAWRKPGLAEGAVRADNALPPASALYPI